MAAFQRRYYAGGGVTTTLSAAMASTDTTFSITADTGWPGSVGTDFFVVIDRGTASEEKILCSSNTGTTVIVANRGQDGTSAVAHSNAATVSLCITALDGDEANQVTHLLGNAAEGALVYGKGAGNLPATLAVGTNGQVLTSNGTDPTWSATNTLVTYAEGAVLYGKGTGTAPTALTIGTNAQVLTSNGTDPEWTALPNIWPFTVDALTVASSAVTVPVTYRSFTITNNAAASVTITMTTTSAVDGQTVMIRFYDYSAVAQTLTWVNTENSGASVPGSSNGSTTLPLTIGFIYNGATSEWRCVAVS
jgi:hypothetical protein